MLMKWQRTQYSAFKPRDNTFRLSPTQRCQRQNNTKKPSSSLVSNSSNYFHCYHHQRKKHNHSNTRQRKVGVPTDVHRYFASLRYVNTSSVLSIKSNKVSTLSILVLKRSSTTERQPHQSNRATNDNVNYVPAESENENESASTAKLHDFCLGKDY